MEISTGFVVPPTLLLTDIEGSTGLLERAPAAYREALDLHHAILRRVTARYGGRELQDAGDGFYLAFEVPGDAVKAAGTMQREFASAPWPEGTGALRVRMALHHGEAEFREGQYRGPVVHLAARLLAAAHGGQVLCSDAVAAFLDGETPVRRLGTHRLRGFLKAQEIFQLGPEGTFPPLRAEHARQHNLPAQQDEFVGRTRELQRLRELLDPAGPAGRLVTLTGTGGIGKSRIALAAAHQLLESYDNGVLFVGLADIAQAEAVPHAILAAFGAEAGHAGQPVARLKEVLAGRPTLIVLDNIEHLAAEGTAMLGHLLRKLPETRWLATSRVRPGLPGAEEIPVEPLPFPGEGGGAAAHEDSESVQLFVKRAARARPGFTLQAHNAEDIAGVCRLLGGLPLAIELAAARLQVLTPGELLEALRADIQSPGDAGGLTAVFEWSRGLLPPSVADFFDTLGVFRGGWTSDAAEKTGGLESRSLTLAYLHFLLTCSLIRVAEQGEGLRFTMLEPIRQFAEERLGKGRADAVSRHGSYFRKLARRVDEDGETAREEAMAREIEPEAANVLAALEREPDNQTRIFSAVDFHSFALRRGCNRAVRSLLTGARPGGGAVKPATLARAWHAAGALDRTAGERASAKDAFGRAAALFEETGEQEGATSALFNLASILSEDGQGEEAYRTFQRTLEYFRERDAPAACATVLDNLGRLSRRNGDLVAARQHLEECLALCKLHDLDGLRSQALWTLARIRLEEGASAQAEAGFLESLGLQHRLGWQATIASTLAGIAMASCQGEAWCRGAYFIGAAKAAARQWPNSSDEETLADLEKFETRAIEDLGEEVFSIQVGRGAADKPDDWFAQAGNTQGKSFQTEQASI
ncbi:MAG: AAA family ATPase [Terrimicrobiaceae bacterium]